MRDVTEGGSRNSLFLRGEAGLFELIGPTTDEPGSTIGAENQAPRLAETAAADLSRIPLKAEVPSSGIDPYLWPGDTTLAERLTLYEYDLSDPNVGSTSSEPKLVGVRNEGRLSSNTEAQLIGQCGTVLGGGTGRINHAVSAEGKYLFFTVLHNEECAGTQPRLNEIYARIDGERTVPVSEPTAEDCAECLQGVEREEAEEAVEAINRQAVFQGASADGSKIFFTSFQQLLPGIGGGTLPNLYRFDFDAPSGGRLQLVSRVAAGTARVQTPPANYSGIAINGERAYFIARGGVELSPGALNEENALHQTPQAGGFNLYMWEAPQEEGQEARISFAATLPANLNPVTTPDGRFVIFTTTAQLTPGDTSTVAQIFEYGADSGALVRVSVGDRGFNDNGNTNVNAPGPGVPVISADGRRVFFESSNALAPGALSDPTDQLKNIYEWTWSGSQPNEADARVFLVLSGTPASSSSGSGSRLEGIDADGDNVFVKTLTPLVPQQTGNQEALYTARVEGGFPEASEDTSCEADACQGVPAIASEGTPLASTLVASGPGNDQVTRHRKRHHKKKRHHKHHPRMEKTTRKAGR